MLTEIRRSVNAEWDRLKREDKTRESLEQSRKRLVEAARGVDGVVETFDPSGRTATAGDRVEVPHLGLKGDVLTVDGGTATVQAGAVTVKVPAQALRVVGRADSGKTTPHPALSPEGRGSRSSPLPNRGRGQGEGARGEGARTEGVVSNELRLIGRTTDEARDLLEKYLDDAFLAGLPSVRVIHGKGTGALRRAVEELLASHPLITSHRPGEPHEGGAGATVAELGQA
jgi:DNA mismatch repair protein MutS2